MGVWAAPAAPKHHSKRWGGKAPELLECFWGRPDPKNRRFPAGPKATCKKNKGALSSRDPGITPGVLARSKRTIRDPVCIGTRNAGYSRDPDTARLRGCTLGAYKNQEFHKDRKSLILWVWTAPGARETLPKGGGFASRLLKGSPGHPGPPRPHPSQVQPRIRVCPRGMGIPKTGGTCNPGSWDLGPTWDPSISGRGHPGIPVCLVSGWAGTRVNCQRLISIEQKQTWWPFQMAKKYVCFKSQGAQIKPRSVELIRYNAN